MSELEIINGCVAGNRVAQKALYDGYCRKMMAICLRYAKTPQEAEDILQDGFVKVFAAIKSFRAESSLATWITRIMINTALNNQRQKLYLLPMIDVTESNLSEGEEIGLSDFHLSELIEIIQSLPDGCRIVFNLFAIEGYSHREIGEMLGISEGTSKSQHNRAKVLLRAKLEAKKKIYEKFGEPKI
jgi:RNA polymerase sigma-70 factor (ECF subfamily)